MNNTVNQPTNLGPGHQYLLDYLKKTQVENPGFFYAAENNNEQCGNIFWADPTFLTNYTYFGDTVRIHTPYKTQHSKVPFITFSGINHHAQPVLFGCALLLNESDASFVWLLQTWSRAMSGPAPVSITSEPDRLIQMSLARVLPETRNRFCRWSIFRQTPEKLTNVYQANPDFDLEFKNCVNESDTVEEFESCWANLLGKYYLIDNEWLLSLYNIRDQWVPVFLREVFFGELSSTMDCTNDDVDLLFDGFSSTSTTIQSLIKQYEKAVSSWQEKELKDDFDTSNTTPVLKTPSPMEKQAAGLYTKRIFTKFQGELVETLANPATVLEDSGSVITYRVAKFGEEHRAHTVRFNAYEMKANCSCRIFDFSGIICRHVLSVFRAKNVLMLPSEYVLRRWTRNARSGVGESMSGSAFGPTSNWQESQMVRHSNLRQEAMKYVEEGAKSIHVYNVAMTSLQEASKRVAAVKSKNVGSGQGTSGGNHEDQPIVNQSSSCLSREEKEKKIRELTSDLERTNQKCEVYRAILLALFRDMEDQKLKLSVKVQNARLSLKDYDVEEIRRIKFWIGAKEPNPLTEDLHHAVKNLSAELYAKDVHFFMELIQNAEDNEYEDDVAPSLQFVVTSKYITGTGAASTLLIFNNEKGFSAKNIESVCSVGRSTKKNNRRHGYIGEKGIGFKSVFLITRQPYIFSSGYQIRFNESPCPECNVGYIVPEWVEENHILSEIKNIYGSDSELPTTTIILPLKPDKVKPVKEQLSSVHPELLLFLSKIKKLSIREDTTAGSMPENTLTSISISSETNFVTRKSIEAESFLLHLSAGETEDSDIECGYYMWRQRFPVKPENKVDRRSDIEEYVITLAFPVGERLLRGSTSPGIYAFLPTEMVTNFPFIIQADFLLGSSRETILMDCNWNSGILNCVPSAFVNALVSLVKEKENAPISNLPLMFGFLPVKSSSYDLLNSVRESIQSKLMEESIMPCESYTHQRYFHKPQEVGRLRPTFWKLLMMARQNKLCLDNISTHGKYILSSVFDQEKNNEFLNFLKVGFVNDEWYAKCVGSSNLVLGGPQGLYLELLLFVAENWRALSNTSLLDVPLIKYVGAQSQVSISRINEIPRKHVILLSKSPDHVSWMIDWNGEFLGVSNRFFLPNSTQCELYVHPKRQIIHDWLTKEAKVSDVSLYDYAFHLKKLLGDDRKRVIAYVHFLHHSVVKNYLSSSEVKKVAGSSMPLVKSGETVSVHAKRLVRWERERRELFMHKLDRSGDRKDVLECATSFAEVISEGLLWDK